MEKDHAVDVDWVRKAAHEYWALSKHLIHMPCWRGERPDIRQNRDHAAIQEQTPKSVDSSSEGFHCRRVCQGSQAHKNDVWLCVTPVSVEFQQGSRRLQSRTYTNCMH